MKLTGLHGREVWFLVGSQHLYGPEALKVVAANAEETVRALNASARLPVNVVCKPVLTSSEAIYRLALEANSNDDCVGIVAWMHTFSPARNWIRGLRALQRPLLHLHTQSHRDLPWSQIDMDFMNLHQAAHGDREFGHLLSKMRIARKTVVGHWSEADVQKRIGTWARSACAWHDWQGMRIARFGDNMRRVAVTEGDKVDAEIAFGFGADGFGVGDLVASIEDVNNDALLQLVDEYLASYDVDPMLAKDGAKHSSLIDAAKIELGLRQFLEQGGFKAFTTTFEDLHGLSQLPGVAVQRLMADGYGFGAEGDWKTAALVRAMKVMGEGLPGATSFMEDYTYHLDPQDPLVLGAHMLEVCASLASGRPSLQAHPLSIGAKPDPVRLVFDSVLGDAVNASLVDLGDRFRLVVNDVESIAPPEPLPRLPVARAVWRAKPSLATAAECWLHAGGAHHTGFSTALGPEALADFAEIAGVEFAHIHGSTTPSSFQDTLRWNAVAHERR